jgi:hypothetical protein
VGDAVNKRILITACFVFASVVSLAQPVLEPRIRYGVVGRPICEDYLKLLNQTKPKLPLQLCGSQVGALPGAKPVDWEELDILHNLALLHRIEWLLRYQIKPKAAFEFKDWLTQFQRRAKNPANLPRIKQARVVIEPDQPLQLVYSYEEDGSECDAKKIVKWEKFFGPFILIDYELKTRHYLAGIRGRPFIYDGRFHLFESYLQNKTHFLQWGASISTFNANEFRRRQSDEYERTSVCGFEDSEIFYPPPRR